MTKIEALPNTSHVYKYDEGKHRSLDYAWDNLQYSDHKPISNSQDWCQGILSISTCIFVVNNE